MAPRAPRSAQERRTGAEIRTGQARLLVGKSAPVLAGYLGREQ